MIDSITLKYQDENKARVITELNHQFVEGCIDIPPKPDKNNPEIGKAAYMKIPIRRRILMHVTKYVADMGGTNFRYIINAR